jgi:molybdopterin molybdotransferase
MNLITVNEALKRILNHTMDFGVEEVPFEESLGRVLREPVNSDRDFPPFDRVSMDGIAIRAADFEAGVRKFEMEGVQPAGSPPLTLANEGACIEIMTGAVLPVNTDAVIPYEQVTISKGWAEVSVENVSTYQNVHGKGTDRKLGDLLIKPNCRISTAEMGVFATVGKTTVSVSSRPRVIVVSTGNELVDVAQTPKDFQIRRSNVHTLQGLLDERGIKADTTHLPDDRDTLMERIQELMDTYDVLMFSGAVSKGKFDYLPEVLNSLGVTKHFHKVAQRPGKPFWFGTKSNKAVFAFPGNPVSTYVCCLRYFMPWFELSSGVTESAPEQALLESDFEFTKPLTYFLQVKLTDAEGTLYARPEVGNGSGDLANLVLADAFLELPQDRSKFKAGETFNVYRFRSR